MEKEKKETKKAKKEEHAEVKETPKSKAAPKSEKKSRSIGLDVAAPAESCTDRHCPFHGELSVRGRTFVGTVSSAKFHSTATVMWERKKFIPKYERYERARTSIKSHNPPCINAKEGDKVMIAECRPISKTKNFVIVSKV